MVPKLPEVKVLLEETVGIHDHPRRAVPALHRAKLLEGELQVVVDLLETELVAEDVLVQVPLDAI